MESRSILSKNSVKLTEDEIRQALVENGLDEKDSNRVLTFRASRDSIDRYKSVLSLRGWNLKNYRSNPVFLYQHNNGCMADSIQVPIGRSINERIVTPRYMSDDPDKIEYHIRADPIPEDDETGLFQTVWLSDTKEGEATLQAYRKGLMNTVSVGFSVKKSIKPKDIPDRFEKHLGGKVEAFLATEQELYELSAVTVPGQVQATQIRDAISNGFNEEFVKLLNLDSTNDRFGNIRGAVDAVNQSIEVLRNFSIRIGAIEDTIKDLSKTLQNLSLVNNNVNKANDKVPDKVSNRVLSKEAEIIAKIRKMSGN